MADKNSNGAGNFLESVLKMTLTLIRTSKNDQPTIGELLKYEHKKMPPVFDEDGPFINT